MVASHVFLADGEDGVGMKEGVKDESTNDSQIYAPGPDSCPGASHTAGD